MIRGIIRAGSSGEESPGRTTPCQDLERRRLYPDERRGEEPVVGDARQEEAGRADGGGRQRVARVAAPCWGSPHPEPEGEEREEQREGERDEGRVVHETVPRSGPRAAYWVGLEGQERHRRAGEEEQCRPRLRAPRRRVVEAARPGGGRVPEGLPADTDHKVVLERRQGREQDREERGAQGAGERRRTYGLGSLRAVPPRAGPRFRVARRPSWPGVAGCTG